MFSQSQVKRGLGYLLLGLLSARAHAVEPVLQELQSEWNRAFPAPAQCREDTASAFASAFDIARKEFLLIRPFECRTATWSRSREIIGSFPAPIRHAHGACVKIITASWHGSGIIISSQGDILTSYHLLAGAPGASIILIDGRVYSVTNIEAFSLTYDVALLKIPELTPTFLSVTNHANPLPGSPLRIVGHPADTSWKLSTGTTLRHYRDRDSPLLHFDSDIGPGNSGGPILDEQGQLCAMTACAADLADGSKVKVGVDIAALRHFISQPRNPISFSELSSQDNNRRMAEFMGTLYIVMEQWLRQWLADLASVTLELESRHPVLIRVVHGRKSGDLSTKLLLLRSLIDHCSESEGLDPRLYQSLAHATASLGHLFDGMAALASPASPEGVRHAITSVTRHRDTAELAFGEALGRLEATGQSLELARLRPDHQQRITTLRETYLAPGCHVDR